MVNFGEIINSSANWTIAVLFKPFNFKKWMLLTLIALLAGSLSSGFNGCNFNYRHSDSAKTSKSTVESSPEASAPSRDKPLLPEEKAVIIGVVAVCIFIVLLLIILFSWLGGRFSFIFIEDVIKRDASVKVPFTANREIGNSYFLFNLSFIFTYLILLGLIVFLCIMTCIKSGIFNTDAPGAKQIFQFFLILLPYLLAAFILIVITALIALVTKDFVLPIMFKDKIGIFRAWPKAFGILRRHIWDFVIYVFIKIGLAIGAAIVYMLAFIICLLGILIPIMLLGFGLYLISRSLPSSALIAYWVAIGVIATPIFLFLLYCLISLNLPFGVFFRTFSMKFLGRLDPQYDLIT